MEILDLELKIKQYISMFKGLDTKTKEQKLSVLNTLVEFFEQKGVVNLRFDERKILDYIDFMNNKAKQKGKTGYKDSSLKIYLSHIREFIDYLSNEYPGCYYNISAEKRIFKTKKSDKKQILYITEAEFIKILEHVKSSKPPIYYILLITLFYSGLRISEALKLMPDDFFVEEEVSETGEIKQLWYIRIKDGKFGKQREVPLVFIPAKFLNTLLSWVKVKHQLKHPVFSYYDEYTGRFVDFSKPHGRININKMLNKISKELKLEKKLSPHIFRKSYTTRLAEKGVALEDLQRWLGHSDIKTTEKIYRAVTKMLKRKRDFQYIT